MGIISRHLGRNQIDLQRRYELAHAHREGSNLRDEGHHIESHYAVLREGIHLYCHNHKDQLQYAFLQIPYRAIQDQFLHQV